MAVRDGVPQSIDALEEALVAAHGLWWRTPGAGRWPFASDGPWHLMQGEAGDYAGDGQDGVSASGAPRTALSAAEVAQRDRAAAWLQLVAVEDRRIVHGATLALWRGEARVPWGDLAKALGWGKTPRALAWTYRRALAQLLCRINGWPSRRWQALVKGDGLAQVVERPAFVIDALDGLEG
jgi:hypothetical protein